MDCSGPLLSWCLAQLLELLLLLLLPAPSRWLRCRLVELALHQHR